MTAKFIPIGDPAHDSERQAIRFLVDGLPDGYTVYGNPWLVERSGTVRELDAVVLAPHAIYVVEIKGYRGRIEGTDHDWYVPRPIKSPLKLNRITAQVLKGRLRHTSAEAGSVWVEGLVFLSATTQVGVRGPASRDRIHTRKTILSAIQDPSLIARLSGPHHLADTEVADEPLLKLFTGTAKEGRRPTRQIREYEIVETLSHQEAYTELVGRNSLSDAERLLRIYAIPHLATDAQRDRIAARARWEAQVLARLGRIEGILSADPPFGEEVGIVLPLEYFRGITLATWLEKYGPEGKEKQKADLRARTDLWMRIAQTMDEAHEQGVVHRLLRPEVILVEDTPEPSAIRVTGFDLAKQLTVDSTISLTTLADERLVSAAPEVVAAFSSAVPASDQFSLGAILAQLLTGKRLFESTRQLMAQRRLLMRVRDLAHRLPLSLDEATSRMVSLRPPDRYPSLKEAIEAVRTGRDPMPRVQVSLPAVEPTTLDVDNLQPKTLIGTDYEVIGRLGQGGMSIVYAAKHLVSGRTRALKIAHAQDATEEALRSEYAALSNLDHPNIVRVVDLTKVVAGRLTLVMERVGGKTLRQWLSETEAPDRYTLRRHAEHLLSGLDYLEQKGITHKDLKPDNLLVSDDHLTIIDFSLVDMPADAPYGGTALYRDPASAEWSHATDRFAAALCLFELYAGRHAFDGRVPEPGQEPAVREDDIDPSGLAAFFKKSLHANPAQRFPSARALRDAFLTALGEEIAPRESIPPAVALELSTPLQTTDLSRRALNALSRSQVTTVGELLALSPLQVRSIHAIGTKTAGEVVAFLDLLKARGMRSGDPSSVQIEPPLVPDLADSPEPIHQLALPSSVLAALGESQLTTVGGVASLTRSQLLAIGGIGRKRLADVVEALHQFASRNPDAENAHTLDRLWDLAARPLTDRQRIVVERVIGVLGAAEQQGIVATTYAFPSPRSAMSVRKALGRLDQTILSDLNNALSAFLDCFGGVVRLDELGQRFEEEWPAGMVTGTGIVRLLVKLSSAHAHLLELDGVEVPIVARTTFDRDTLQTFVAEVLRLAAQWPPLEQESARRTLVTLLPEYDSDPLHLGERLCEDVEQTDAGQLFISPVDAKLSLAFVLDQARGPITFDELKHNVERTFGEHTPYPEADHLLELLAELECRVQGDAVIPGRTGSVIATPALTADEVPGSLGSERSPEEVVRDMLTDAANSRGFRMLVTPPEKHAEIGQSITRAIGGTWLSFNDAFFSEHSAEMSSLERAERFVAQRDTLTEAAEETLFRLLDEHGQRGRTVVLGDTALLGLCDALDFPRRLYDETLSGGRGFWVLVVPGVIHNRQPRFNEGPPMWHLEGATLPLLNPLPSAASNHPPSATGAG